MAACLHLHRTRLGLALLAVLVAAPAALAYELRRDSSGQPVRWEGPVRVHVPAELDAQLGTVGALEATEAAAAEFRTAGATLELGLSHGGPRAAGFDFGDRASNRNDVVVPEEWDFDPSSIAVTVLTLDARAHRILDADVLLNAAHRRFRVLPPEGEEGGAWDDVQNTLTHELGHALGLAHNPAAPEAVMYPTALRGETSKRRLAADDRAGLAALYAMPPVRGCSVLSAAPGAGAGPLLLLLLALLLEGATPRAHRRRPRRPHRVDARTLALLSCLLALPGGATATRREPPVLAEASSVLMGRVVRVQTLAPAPSHGGLLRSEVEVQLEQCVRGQCPPRLVVLRPGGRWGDVEQVVEGEELPAPGDRLGVVVGGTRAAARASGAPLTRLYVLHRARDLQAFASALEAWRARPPAAPAPAPVTPSGNTPPDAPPADAR